MSSLVNLPVLLKITFANCSVTCWGFLDFSHSKTFIDIQHWLDSAHCVRLLGPGSSPRYKSSPTWWLSHWLKSRHPTKPRPLSSSTGKTRLFQRPRWWNMLRNVKAEIPFQALLNFMECSWMNQRVWQRTRCFLSVWKPRSVPTKWKQGCGANVSRKFSQAERFFENFTTKNICILYVGGQK